MKIKDVKNLERGKIILRDISNKKYEITLLQTERVFVTVGAWKNTGGDWLDKNEYFIPDKNVRKLAISSVIGKLKLKITDVN